MTRLFRLCALACCALPIPLLAQAPRKLKVYISVDMEGIAGIVAASQTSSGGANYEWARRLMLAEAFQAVGDFPGALRESVRAADLLPDNLSAQLLAGNQLLLAQSFQDAGGRADRVLARDPANAEALILKGNALAGLNDFDAALNRYEQAAKSAPGNETGYIGIGAVELNRGKQQAG